MLRPSRDCSFLSVSHAGHKPPLRSEGCLGNQRITTIQYCCHSLSMNGPGHWDPEHCQYPSTLGGAQARGVASSSSWRDYHPSAEEADLCLRRSISNHTWSLGSL